MGPAPVIDAHDEHNCFMISNLSWVLHMLSLLVSRSSMVPFIRILAKWPVLCFTKSLSHCRMKLQTADVLSHCLAI